MSNTLIPKQTAALTAGVSFFAAILLAFGFGCEASAIDAAASKTTLTFTESSVTAEGGSSGYEIEGTDLTINSSGVYELTGICGNGSVTVKKGTEDVTLILNGLTLTSTDSAAISCNKETDVTIEVAGDSKLTNAEDIANEEADTFDGAVIKVKSGADLKITGSGTLYLNGDCKNGIKGGASSVITVDGASLQINAANNGLASDHSVVINSGSLNIIAGNDGIKAEPDEDDTESAGTVTIHNGTISVDAQGDGIQATGDLSIEGGTIKVTSGDDAVKSEANVTIFAGTLTIDAEDDGIHAEYVLNIGVKGATAGPDITIIRCEEGLEGAAVNLYSGKASVTSSDDGINAANKDLTDYTYEINVYDGTWYVNANGDAMDSNRNINIYGGVTELHGSPDGGNNALDYDGLCSVEDGSLFTVDCTEMNQTPSYGTYVVFGKTGGMGFSMTPPISQDGQTADPSNFIENGEGQRRDGASQANGGMQTGGRGPAGEFNAEDIAGAGMPAMPENMTPPDWTENSGDNRQRPTPPEMGSQMSGAGETGIITIQKDSKIEVKDSSGATLYSTVGTKYANCVMLASADLNPGETYTLFVDGKEAASAEAVEGTGQGGMGFGPDGQAGGWPERQGQDAGQSGQQKSDRQIEQSAIESANQAATGYLDVSEKAWYWNSVCYVTEKGIMNGTGNQRFSPDVSTTRAMVVTILYRLEGSPSVSGSSFRDEQAESYYADAVAWAEQNGIVNGTGNGAFSPDSEITREQLAAILYRYAQYKGQDVSGTAELNDYIDCIQVQEYARSAMEWACATGLIQGTNDKALQPRAAATRAQVATILQRLCTVESI